MKKFLNCFISNVFFDVIKNSLAIKKLISYCGKKNYWNSFSWIWLLYIVFGLCWPEKNFLRKIKIFLKFNMGNSWKKKFGFRGQCSNDNT